ncbi:MAG: hypothetical protein ACU84J_06765, partial [Gammaproteobacteria bacterium]
MKKSIVVGLLFTVSLSVGKDSFAEVALDGSFGHAASITGPNYDIRAEMGRHVGSNLFHSFAV